MELLAETGTWVTHQPRSNMNNGVGAAQVESMLRLGVRVGLGTDGFPHAMWEELRFAYMLQKVVHLAAADLILVDYPAHTPVTPENFPWHVIFGFHESMVTTTIVAGRVLMQDRRVLTLDEKAILEEARAKAPEVWQRYRSLVR